MKYIKVMEQTSDKNKRTRRTMDASSEAFIIHWWKTGGPPFCKQPKAAARRNKLAKRRCTKFPTCPLPHTHAFATLIPSSVTNSMTTIRDKNKKIALTKIIPPTANIQKIRASRPPGSYGSRFLFNHQLTTDQVLKEYQKSHMYSTRRLLRSNRRQLMNQLPKFRRSSSSSTLVAVDEVKLPHDEEHQRHSRIEGGKLEKVMVIGKPKKSALIQAPIAIVQVNPDLTHVVTSCSSAQINLSKGTSIEDKTSGAKTHPISASSTTIATNIINVPQVTLRIAPETIHRATSPLQPTRTIANKTSAEDSRVHSPRTSQETFRNDEHDVSEPTRNDDSWILHNEASNTPQSQPDANDQKESVPKLASQFQAIMQMTKSSKDTFSSIQERLQGYAMRRAHFRLTNFKPQGRISKSKESICNSKYNKNEKRESLCSGITINGLLKPSILNTKQKSKTSETNQSSASWSNHGLIHNDNNTNLVTIFAKKDAYAKTKAVNSDEANTSDIRRVKSPNSVSQENLDKHDVRCAHGGSNVPTRKGSKQFNARVLRKASLCKTLNIDASSLLPEIAERKAAFRTKPLGDMSRFAAERSGAHEPDRYSTQSHDNTKYKVSSHSHTTALPGSTNGKKQRSTSIENKIYNATLQKLERQGFTCYSADRNKDNPWHNLNPERKYIGTGTLKYNTGKERWVPETNNIVIGSAQASAPLERNKCSSSAEKKNKEQSLTQTVHPNPSGDINRNTSPDKVYHSTSHFFKLNPSGVFKSERVTLDYSGTKPGWNPHYPSLASDAVGLIKPGWDPNTGRPDYLSSNPSGLAKPGWNPELGKLGHFSKNSKLFPIIERIRIPQSGKHNKVATADGRKRVSCQLTEKLDVASKIAYASSHPMNHKRFWTSNAFKARSRSTEMKDINKILGQAINPNKMIGGAHHKTPSTGEGKRSRSVENKPPRVTQEQCCGPETRRSTKEQGCGPEPSGPRCYETYPQLNAEYILATSAFLKHETNRRMMNKTGIL